MGAHTAEPYFSFVISCRENTEGRYTLAFLGYGPEEDNCVFELTYNWDRAEPYDRGGGYAQIALSTQVGALT